MPLSASNFSLVTPPFGASDPLCVNACRWDQRRSLTDDADYLGSAALGRTGVLCGSLVELDDAELAEWRAATAEARARREAAAAERADEGVAFWDAFDASCAELRRAAEALEIARREAATRLIACQVMTRGVRDCAEAADRVGVAIGRHLAELAKGAM
ncbi:hypothetical protein [Streptomyces niveus]|uniref:hypothetical protein n=1 Tax=Streptomyces niveus TaxID=193462 RepID=UPI0034286064